MVDVHHIQWLFVETENGGQLRYLAPGQAPKAVFELGGESRGGLRLLQPAWSVDDGTLRNEQVPASG